MDANQNPMEVRYSMYILQYLNRIFARCLNLPTDNPNHSTLKRLLTNSIVIKLHAHHDMLTDSHSDRSYYDDFTQSGTAVSADIRRKQALKYTYLQCYRTQQFLIKLSPTTPGLLLVELLPWKLKHILVFHYIFTFSFSFLSSSSFSPIALWIYCCCHILQRIFSLLILKHLICCCCSCHSFHRSVCSYWLSFVCAA